MGNIKKSIKDLGVSVNGVEPQGETLGEVLKSFGNDFTGTDTGGNTIAEVVENIGNDYVQPVFVTKNITENGTYQASSDNADGYDEVNVNVQPTLLTKNINANGTYTAQSDNAYGYSSVNVNVPQGIPQEISTENEMTALLVPANIGKAYKYTGTTGTYTNGNIYVVEGE